MSRDYDEWMHNKADEGEMPAAIKGAGYIVCDDVAVWGYGATAEAAWADMLAGMKSAGITVVDETSEDDLVAGSQTLASNFKTGEATAALLRQVEERGGNIAWGQCSGVYCTREEENAAIEAAADQDEGAP